MASCGAAIAGLLDGYGIDTVFGIPGNHTLEFYRGFASAGIRHVTTRHEQGAAFMADGYARATGRPGVCCLISGPGLLNAATAIAQARADSIPMLVLTSVRARPMLGREFGTLHELPDQRAAAATFCRRSVTLERVGDLEGAFANAFQDFAAARPGPVHIEVPLDVAAEELTSLPRAISPTPPPRPTSPTVAAMATALAGAARPVFITGGGCRRAGEHVRAIAEHFAMPVVNTVNAKGLLPSGHALRVGASPSLEPVRRLIRRADVVLAAGTEFGETDFDLLMTGALRFPGRLLRIDIDPDQLRANQEPDLGLHADAAAALGALLEFPGRRTASGDAARQTMETRAAVRAARHFNADFEALFETILSVAPDAILFGDSTRPTYYAAWHCEPGQAASYHHSVTGFGTLGYALPAAIGAAATGAPRARPVIALTGDGGLQYTLNELATAVDQRVPLPVLVWCNDGFEEIAHSLASRGIPTTSTRIGGPQLDVLARAYGCASAAPASLEQLARDLADALARPVPTLIALAQARFTHGPSGDWY